MRQRKPSRLKQILGKMMLNLGRVQRYFYGPAAGATIIDMPESGRPRAQRRRNKRKR